MQCGSALVREGMGCHPDCHPRPMQVNGRGLQMTAFSVRIWFDSFSWINVHFRQCLMKWAEVFYFLLSGRSEGVGRVVSVSCERAFIKVQLSSSSVVSASRSCIVHRTSLAFMQFACECLREAASATPLLLVLLSPLAEQLRGFAVKAQLIPLWYSDTCENLALQCFWNKRRKGVLLVRSFTLQACHQTRLSTSGFEDQSVPLWFMNISQMRNCDLESSYAAQCQEICWDGKLCFHSSKTVQVILFFFSFHWISFGRKRDVRVWILKSSDAVHSKRNLFHI